MPRPHKERRVQQLPPIREFKPAGVPMRDIEEIILTIEEMEAIRLADVEQLDQATAAEQMGISSPTFNRIVNKAHQKVGTALWQGKALRIEGGSFRLQHQHHHRLRTFFCESCGHEWGVPHGNGQSGHDLQCPSCQSNQIKRKG